MVTYVFYKTVLYFDTLLLLFTCLSQDPIKPNDAPPSDELDMEFTLLAKARSIPNLMHTGDVMEQQLSADVMDLLSGDCFPASHAFGVSAEDMQRC